MALPKTEGVVFRIETDRKAPPFGYSRFWDDCSVASPADFCDMCIDRRDAYIADDGVLGMLLLLQPTRRPFSSG
jgi:hypothetical protein